MAAHILNDFIVVNCTSAEVDPNNECIHFLTHIGRHQTNLVHVISSHIKKVYTSEFNIWYLKTFFGANASQFISVPLWTRRKVKSKESSFTFEFLNANHCPGAVMILFKGDFGSYLYSGNCRYSPAMLDYTSLKPYSQGTKFLDKLYVNAAYLNMDHNFPKREIAIRQVLDFISEHSDKRIYICARLLGKEDILFRIALELNENIYVSQDKLKILNKLGYKSSLFTTEICLARLRVVDTSEITALKMKRRRLTEKCVAIVFSACNTNEDKMNKHGIYIFPASDHSSATETKMMIKAFKASDIYLLNKESTLSEQMKAQKNNGCQTVSDVSSPVICQPINGAKSCKSVKKKRFSLKLKSVGDENQPPSSLLNVGVAITTNSTNVLKDSQNTRNCNVNNRNNSNSSKSKSQSIVAVNSSNENDNSSTIFPKLSDNNSGSDNSFLIDGNARTGFSTSSEQNKSHQVEMSPSFPPSVSDIVLTNLNDTSSSDGNCRGKHSFASSESCGENGICCAAQKSQVWEEDEINNENCVIAESSSKESSNSGVIPSEVNNSCNISPSYPQSVSGVIPSLPSNRESKSVSSKKENTNTQKVISNTSDENSGKQTPVYRSSSEASNSPLNMFSPSFPPSVSNIVLTKLSSKMKNAADSVSPGNSLIDRQTPTVGKFSPETSHMDIDKSLFGSSITQKVPKNIFRPSHSKPYDRNNRKSYYRILHSSISNSESENDVPLTKDGPSAPHRSGFADSKMGKCSNVLEAISEVSYSPGRLGSENQKKQISQDLNDHQEGCLTMNFTRILTEKSHNDPEVNSGVLNSDDCENGSSQVFAHELESGVTSNAACISTNRIVVQSSENSSKLNVVDNNGTDSHNAPGEREVFCEASNHIPLVSKVPKDKSKTSLFSIDKNHQSSLLLTRCELSSSTLKSDGISLNSLNHESLKLKNDKLSTILENDKQIDENDSESRIDELGRINKSDKSFNQKVTTETLDDNNSLFIADGGLNLKQRLILLDDSIELTLCSNAMKSAHTEKEQIKSTVSTISKEAKHPEQSTVVSVDESTVLFEKHTVACDIHRKPRFPRQVTSTTPNLYDQSTIPHLSDEKLTETVASCKQVVNETDSVTSKSLDKSNSVTLPDVVAESYPSISDKSTLSQNSCSFAVTSNQSKNHRNSRKSRKKKRSSVVPIKGQNYCSLPLLKSSFSKISHIAEQSKTVTLSHERKISNYQSVDSTDCVDPSTEVPLKELDVKNSDKSNIKSGLRNSQCSSGTKHDLFVSDVHVSNKSKSSLLVTDVMESGKQTKNKVSNDIFTSDFSSSICKSLSNVHSEKFEKIQKDGTQGDIFSKSHNSENVLSQISSISLNSDYQETNNKRGKQTLLFKASPNLDQSTQTQKNKTDENHLVEVASKSTLSHTQSNMNEKPDIFKPSVCSSQSTLFVSDKRKYFSSSLPLSQPSVTSFNRKLHLHIASKLSQQSAPSQLNTQD